MRRFLKKIVWFALPLLLLAVVLEVVGESIPNSYTYKRRYMEQYGAQIQTLILGSSNAYDGIDPSRLPAAFNLANSSQTLADDSRLLLKYIDQMPELQMVILGIGYKSLDMDGFANRRTYYTIYMDLYPRFPVSEYSFEVFQLEQLTKKIVKYVVSRDVTRCDSLGLRLGHSRAAVEQNVEFWNRDVAQMAMNDYIDVEASESLINRNFNYVCDIIDACRQRGVLPVIVNMPAREEYRALLTEEQRQMQQQALEDWSPYALCIDASTFVVEEDGWYNATHLTREQAQVFTDSLWAVIERQLQP